MRPLIILLLFLTALFPLKGAEEVKKDKYALPSAFEVLDGLRKFNEILITQQAKGQPV